MLHCEVMPLTLGHMYRGAHDTWVAIYGTQQPRTNSRLHNHDSRFEHVNRHGRTVNRGHAKVKCSRGGGTSERTIPGFDAQMSLDLNADLDGTVPLAPVAGSGNTHTCLVECRQRTTKFPRLSTRGMFCLSRLPLSPLILSQTCSGLAPTRAMYAQTIPLAV